MRKSRPSRASFTADDVRLMLSSPAYGYGINLQPAERAAEAVMQLNIRLAQEMLDTGKAFTLEELDQRFQDLFNELETSGICRRGVDSPPIVTKEQWLQAQPFVPQWRFCWRSQVPDGARAANAETRL